MQLKRYKIESVHNRARGSNQEISLFLDFCGTSLVDLLCVFFCIVFAMSLCASVFMCFVVTCWERTDLLALVCGV